MQWFELFQKAVILEANSRRQNIPNMADVSALRMPPSSLQVCVCVCLWSHAVFFFFYLNRVQLYLRTNNIVNSLCVVRWTFYVGQAVTVRALMDLNAGSIRSCGRDTLLVSSFLPSPFWKLNLHSPHTWQSQDNTVNSVLFSLFNSFSTGAMKTQFTMSITRCPIRLARQRLRK